MNIDALLDKTIVDICGAKRLSPEIIFTCSDGTSYKMYHFQDCCEKVLVEDVCGDVADLIGVPIVRAHETTNSLDGGIQPKSITWTFYHIVTIKGYVTIRWLGTSNGFYSEEVNFDQLTCEGENHDCTIGMKPHEYRADPKPQRREP